MVAKGVGKTITAAVAKTVTIGSGPASTPPPSGEGIGTAAIGTTFQVG